jgi:hypothetical protein
MGIAKVSSTYIGQGTTTPTQITISAVAGNTLIVVVNYLGSSFTTGSVTGVTDNHGGVWSQVSGATTNSPTSYNSTDTEMWICLDAPGGSTIISVAFTGTVYGSSGANDSVAWVGQFSGINGTDGTANIVPGTSGSPNPSTKTPSQSGDLALVVLNTPYSGTTALPSTPWFNETITPLQGNVWSICWQVVAGASPVTATWTIGASENWGAITALFSPSLSPVSTSGLLLIL